jgi:DNA-directed RNA polymerase subunit N (RpoN/RPB10)
MACPLDLDRLIDADDFNLVHDVAGIDRHMCRRTFKLLRGFWPRFASKQ